jgi:hypothetical protein
MASQKIYIWYGQFPDNKEGIQRLDQIEAFYSFGKTNKKREGIFYKLDIKMKDGKAYTEVNSVKENWCQVLVFGKKKTDNLGRNYLAKISFFIHGKSNKPQLFTGRVVNPPKSVLDIRLFREHIKEDVYGDYHKLNLPIRATVILNNKPFSNENIKIINESKIVEQFKIDRKGNIVFNLPQHIKYHPKRGTGKEFEQELILTSYHLDNSFYIVSYAVLFNTDFTEMKNFDHNIRLGMIIFLVSIIISFICILIIRKARIGEDL